MKQNFVVISRALVFACALAQALPAAAVQPGGKVAADAKTGPKLE